MKLLLIIALLLIPVVAMAEFTGTFALYGGDGLTQARCTSCSDYASCSTCGARFTYSGTDGGVAYSLYGRIWLPTSTGTYPGIVINHGAFGGPEPTDPAVPLGMANIGTPMRDWGAVVIAITLEHCNATNEALCPGGDCNPGGATAGASLYNTQRIMKAYDMLDNVETIFPTYSVDTARVAAHGHSAGAYAVTACLDANTTTFLVASHTGGGYDATETFNYTPTDTECDGIITPYSLHHGDTGTVGSPSGTDGTVVTAWDTALNGRLDGPHELTIYYETTHAESNGSATVLANILDWYTTYGMFDTSTCTGVSLTGATIQ